MLVASAVISMYLKISIVLEDYNHSFAPQQALDRIFHAKNIKGLEKAKFFIMN